MKTCQEFLALLCGVAVLSVLQTSPACGQEEKKIGNDAIRQKQSNDHSKSYPRQGEFGQDTSRPPAAQTGRQDSKQTSTTAPPIRHDRQRNLNSWKPGIADYSARHYGESSWQLDPTCIVLHYTAGTSFPWNLVDSQSFAGEKPGLASHYVIDGNHIWQILPPNVRSRATYGINHRALSIEMVAADASDLSRRAETLKSCAQLVAYLSAKHGIPLSKVYSHQQVGRMDRKVVPEALDLVDPRPYGKIDPGESNMQTIKRQVTQLQR